MYLDTYRHGNKNHETKHIFQPLRWFRIAVYSHTKRKYLSAKRNNQLNLQFHMYTREKNVKCMKEFKHTYSKTC